LREFHGLIIVFYFASYCALNDFLQVYPELAEGLRSTALIYWTLLFKNFTGDWPAGM
jgi:hypothetical protein